MLEMLKMYLETQITYESFLKISRRKGSLFFLRQSLNLTNIPTKSAQVTVSYVGKIIRFHVAVRHEVFGYHVISVGVKSYLGIGQQSLVSVV